MQIPQTFALALQLHQTGRLAEAEALYRQILAVDPRHAQSLHLLGAIASQAGRNDVAVTLIRQAIEITPNDSTFHYNLGSALRELGRLEECAAAYQRAVQIKPDYAMAYNNLGSALKELGRTEAAFAAFQQALRIEPGCVFACNNAGNILREKGRLDEAIAAYRQALHFKPDYAEAHSNLGVALADQGHPDAAIAAHRLSLRFNPNLPETHYNLGVVLNAQGRIEETVAAFRQALALKANYPEGHYNLGVAYGKLERLDDAVAAYRQALDFKPSLAEAWNNMGNALKELGQMDAALVAYRQALALQPDYPIAHSNLLLGLHCAPAVDPPTLFREHVRWDESYAQRWAAGIQPHVNQVDPERRLRIGYVSADFRDHAVAYFLEDLLASHDPAQVEVFCYANVPLPDAFTIRLQKSVPHWRDLTRLSDDQAAELIRADTIDILVDLSGHTAGNRLLVFARKPAPIQVTYLGYCDTTGLKTMDYRLTDAQADPPGMSEPWHTEQLMRLPDGAWCFRPWAEAPSVQAPPAGESGQITFGCFNALPKITQPLIGLWARILGQVPGSRLLLKNAGLQNASARQRTLAQLEAAGIAPDRVEVAGRLRNVVEHLAHYGRVDIALDTFPYHGTTTTCEALWMGVPVVILAGSTHASRVGVSLLHSLDLPQWIAVNGDDYVRIAVELAGDVSELTSTRRSLRERMAASPLMDGPRLARNVETAFQTMWRTWCEGQMDLRP